MEGGSSDRWRERVAECDLVLAEDGDSPDPVAQRRVVSALRTKARALEQLGCHEECARVWDEMAGRFAEDPPAGAAPFIPAVLLNKGLALFRAGLCPDAVRTLDDVVARCEHLEDSRQAQSVAASALSAKSEALMRSQGAGTARGVDAEIIRRFSDVTDPSVRARVAFALVRRASWLLTEGRIDEALEVSDQLVGRFRAEDDPSVRERIGEMLLTHTRALLSVGSARLDSIALLLLAVLTGALREGAGAVARRLPLDYIPGQEFLGRLRPVSGIRHVVRQQTPVVAVTARHKRAAQARLLSGALIEGFGTATEPDQQRIAVTARLYAAVAAVLLGRVVDGFRSFNTLMNSGQEAVAEAFRTQAARARSDGGFVGEFGTVSNLALRARTLGQGDPRFTRIAFEESVRTDGPSSRKGRWIARLLAPGKN